MDSTVRRGLFEFVTGPMFAGKTELLLERLAAADARGERALAVKPLVDTRWPNEILSHSKARRAAATIRDGNELLELASESEIVGIDEAQFLGSDLVDAVVELRHARHVVVAGLDLDFRGEPFAVVPKLIAQADVVHRLRAVCGSCGDSATMTQRFLHEEPAPFDDVVVLVGGDELYAPRCVRCYQAERDALAVQTA